MHKSKKMHKSKNIVHINTKAKRSQTSCLQEVWPFYSLTSVKDGIIAYLLAFRNSFTSRLLHKSDHNIHTVSARHFPKYSNDGCRESIARVFDTLFAP